MIMILLEPDSLTSKEKYFSLPNQLVLLTEASISPF